MGDTSVCGEPEKITNQQHPTNIFSDNTTTAFISPGEAELVIIAWPLDVGVIVKARSFGNWVHVRELGI